MINESISNFILFINPKVCFSGVVVQRILFFMDNQKRQDTHGASQPEGSHPLAFKTTIDADSPAVIISSEDVETLWAVVLDEEDEAQARKTLKPRRFDLLYQTRISHQLHLRLKETADKGVHKQPAAEYELMEKIAEGGVGQIYEAHQTCLNRTIALKMLRPDRMKQAERRDDFLAEAAVMANLEHPHILPVHDVGINAQQRPFYAMKHVHGEDWCMAMEKRDLDDNLDILLKVCDAVAFAHSHNVIHRDLKPENVMLGEFGEVLVMDWGLASSVADGSKADLLTSRKALSGTPAYMAPEMARGQVLCIGKRSDVYLLGAILYEIITGFPPHRGKDIYQCLANAANNKITPTRKKSELLNISLKAMAHRPEERFANVEAFRDALRDYRRHAESIGLTERALDEEHRAGAEHNYDLFAQTIAHFQQALSLWAENQRAREGLSHARWHYAELAFDSGDFGLAGSLLDPGDPAHANALKRLVSARHHAARKAHRIWMLRLIEIFVVIGIAGFMAWFSSDWFQRFGKWKLVYREEYRKSSTSTGLEFVSRAGRSAPVKTAQAGGLVLRNSEPVVWFKNIRINGDVKVELTARWEQDAEGLDIFINAQRAAEPDRQYVPVGYSCHVGGWLNTLHAISRNDSSGMPSSANAVDAGLTPRQTYRIVFQRLDDLLTLTLNGRTVLCKLDPLPLRGESFGSIGFRSHGHLTILSSEVWRRALPRKTTPLLAGDTLMALHHQREASATYHRIAMDFSHGSLEERALAKAYLAGCRTPRSETVIPVDALKRMHEQYPRSPYLMAMLEEKCLRRWSRGEFEAALDEATAILRMHANSRIALRLLEKRPAGLPGTISDRLLESVAGTRQVRVIDVSRMGLTDLEWAVGLELRHLNCRGNRISDLTPLENMPLLTLDCSDNMLQSLHPLKTKELSRLESSGNPFP